MEVAHKASRKIFRRCRREDMQLEQRLAGTERGLEDIEQSAKAKVMVPFFKLIESEHFYSFTLRTVLC